MSRALWPLIGFAALAGLLGVGLYATRHRNDANMVIVESPLLGKPAPEFQLPDLLNDGQRVATTVHNGQWRLFNVWGTWCGECRVEHGTLLEIHKNPSIRIVGIDWKDDDNEARNWLRTLGNPYDVVAADRDGRVAVDYGVYAAPENFLVDPQGRVCVKQTGGMTMEIWNARFVPHLARPDCRASG